jgi:antitoxin VapB
VRRVIGRLDAYFQLFPGCDFSSNRSHRSLLVRPVNRNGNASARRCCQSRCAIGRDAPRFVIGQDFGLHRVRGEATRCRIFWIFEGFYGRILHMIDLSHETEALAKRLADAQRLSVDAAIRRALEKQAEIAGEAMRPARRRMSIEEMLAVGDEIAAMPLLDPRSPQEIMDDLNAI